MMLERDWDEARFYTEGVEDHREPEERGSHGRRIRQIQARLSRLVRHSVAVEDERGLVDLAQQLEEVVSDLREIVPHERRITKTIALDGPMTSNIQILREQLALIEAAERIERQGFRELASGSRLGEEKIFRRAKENFYLTAAQALDLGLIAAVV